MFSVKKTKIRAKFLANLTIFVLIRYSMLIFLAFAILALKFLKVRISSLERKTTILSLFIFLKNFNISHFLKKNSTRQLKIPRRELLKHNKNAIRKSESKVELFFF